MAYVCILGVKGCGGTVLQLSQFVPALCACVCVSCCNMMCLQAQTRVKLEFLDKLAQFWDLQVCSVHGEEEVEREGGREGGKEDGGREREKVRVRA